MIQNQIKKNQTADEMQMLRARVRRVLSDQAVAIARKVEHEVGRQNISAICDRIQLSSQMINNLIEGKIVGCCAKQMGSGQHCFRLNIFSSFDFFLSSGSVDREKWSLERLRKLP